MFLHRVSKALSYVHVQSVAKVVDESFVQYSTYFVSRRPRIVGWILLLKRNKSIEILSEMPMQLEMCLNSHLDLIGYWQSQESNWKLNVIFIFISIWKLNLEENVDILLLNCSKMRIFFINNKHLFPWGNCRTTSEEKKDKKIQSKRTMSFYR